MLLDRQKDKLFMTSSEEHYYVLNPEVYSVNYFYLSNRDMRRAMATDYAALL